MKNKELKPGWLKRALKDAVKETNKWPQWKKDMVDFEFPICEKDESKSSK